MTRPSQHRSRPVASWQSAILLVFVLIGLLLAGTTPGAQPVRLEAQAGQCNLTLADEGVWWNDAYPTLIDLRSTCFQLGLSQVTYRHSWADLGWRASYVNLGRVSADNTFAAWDEDQFTTFDKKDCKPNGRYCVARGQIKGNTKGFTASGIAERSWGDLRFGAELGLFIYYSVFEVAVSLPDKPHWGTVSRYRWADWTATSMLGLTANYGYAFATVRGYRNVVAHEQGQIGHSGLWDGPAWSALIGFQIPLK